MSEDAKARLERGLEHYSAKDYEAAIDELSRAYDLEPHPVFLYTWAQAERLSGDCPSAVTLYQRFLDTDPDESQAAAAASNKERCEEALGTSPDGADVEPSVPPETTPPAPVSTSPTGPDETAPEPRPIAPTSPKSMATPPDATPPEPAPASWVFDPLGGTLLGLGLVGAGVGVGLWIASASDLRTAGEAESGNPTETYGQHVGRLDSAQTKRTSSVILIAAGSTLAVAAVVRYIVVGTSEPKGAAQLDASVWLGIDGAGAGYGRAF